MYTFGIIQGTDGSYSFVLNNKMTDGVSIFEATYMTGGSDVHRAVMDAVERLNRGKLHPKHLEHYFDGADVVKVNGSLREPSVNSNIENIN